MIGFHAQLVSYELNIDEGWNLFVDNYYFENNGVCYCVQIHALQDKAEQFYSDIQPILGSIKIK